MSVRNQRSPFHGNLAFSGPTRTARTAIYWLVLNPSAFRMPNTAFRMVRLLLPRIRPYLLVGQPLEKELQYLPPRVGWSFL